MKTLFKSFIDNPSGIAFEGEDNDEEILFMFRKAMITNARWLLVTGILSILPFAFNYLLLNLRSIAPNIISGGAIFVINAFWYLFTFGFFFERFLNWFFNVHIITNKRVVDMDFDHLLHRNISEAPLRNIEDTTYTISGALQTTFNYGTVSVQTAAEQREIEFINVANPSKIQDLLSDLVQSVKRDFNS